LDFIETELKPIINKNYKTAGYEILIGHSLGGLFTVNALMANPEFFNAYIAISPSLWWNDYQAEKDVEAFFKKHKNLNRFLYLSLRDEQGMGVLGFYEQLDRHTFGDKYYKNPPLGLDFTFTHYPEENHGSVGFVTVNDALKLLFKNYDVQYKTISKLATFEEYEAIMKPYAAMIGEGFRLPDAQIKSLIAMFYDKNMGELLKMETAIKERFPVSLGDYYNHLRNLYLKKGETKKAIEILEKNAADYPNSPEFLTSLGDAYFKNKDTEKAKTTYKEALALGKKNHARNWYLNQLEANVLLIDN
jgi:tetratricopeptide (TPR) repeat protein